MGVVSQSLVESSAAEYEQLMKDYTALWNGEFSNLDVVAESVDLVHPSAPDAGDDVRAARSDQYPMSAVSSDAARIRI